MAWKHNGDLTEEAWSRVLSRMSLRPDAEFSQSPFNRARRAYIVDDFVYKLSIPQYANPDDYRAQDLAGEHALLQELAGTKGVPVAVGYSRPEGAEALCLERIHGRSLTQIRTGWFSMATLWVSVSLIILKLAWRRISHNDISEDNILVSGDGRVTLIDFDQATRTSFPKALVRGLTGISVGAGAVHGCMLSTIGQFRRRIGTAGA